MRTRRSLPTRLGEGAARRRSFKVDAESLVCRGDPVTATSLPAVFVATRPDVRLAEWLGARRDAVHDLLHAQGAVLFRGFPLRRASALEQVMQASSGAEAESYDYRSTPRSRVEGRVYTSTDYPADQTIPQHSEQAYSRAFPRALGFLCLAPSRVGGATPIADNRRVLGRIPKPVRDRFERHGVLYVRNYGGPLDLGWREVFQVDERAAVEAYCAAEGIDVAWGADDRLRTRQVCQAVFAHPVTGEAVWFNQAHLFHVSALGAADRETLLATCGGEQQLPRQAYYGNGDPIPDAELEVVRAAIAAETVRFDWQAGDLLLVDNLLASHGREPFDGERRVVVCMTGAASWRPHAAGDEA